MQSGNILLTGVAWFVSSAVLSTYSNTTFLKTFSSPWNLTLVRFIGSALFGLLLNVFQAPDKKLTPAKYKEVLPLFSVSAVLLFTANFLNGVALQHSGITLTYVVKASIPLFTVLYSRVIVKKTYPVTVYFSLIPTVVGVALAAWSDSDFTISGFLAAFASTIAQTALNLQVKDAFSRTSISGTHAQFVMVSCASVVLIIYQVASAAAGAIEVRIAYTTYEVGVILVTAAAYHSEYVLNFLFTGLVSSVTFSVADIARRLAVIVVGALLFGKELTPLNIAGVGLALSGVFGYSYLLSKEQADKTK